MQYWPAGRAGGYARSALEKCDEGEGFFGTEKPLPNDGEYPSPRSHLLLLDVQA